MNTNQRVAIVATALFLLIVLLLRHLNEIIDRVPFEMHIPGYNYCGPGTNLDKGEQPVNKLDEACRDHDYAYKLTSPKHRNEADLILAIQAWRRVFSTSAGLKERFWAFWVSIFMLLKHKLGV